MKKSNVITEGALFSAIYLLLLLMTLYIPFIEIVSIFLLPLPFVIYAYKNGIQASVIMFLATSVLTIIVASIFSLPLTLMAGIGGITVGVCLHYKKSVYETWATGAVAFALGFLAILGIGQLLFQVNFVDELNNLIDISLQNTQELIKQLGTSEEALLQIEEQMKQLTYLIPTIIGFIGILYSFLAIWFGFKIINRLENKTYAFPPLRDFKLPISLIWYYFIAMILMWVDTEQGSTLNQAAVNIFTLVGALITLQGLSFIFYYVHAKKKSKGIIIGTIVMVVLLPFIFLYPLRILGIIDLGFNLRDRLNKESK
ncbi:uncharacterized protein YybS (DUF2232 family) [Salirhabdus euzebyi]|uniref:Uncharacterized protein YybS (DUF2232 family) n=1 Tax=Salirhabdus euzebyi TaxID=394506 RepID=A0A841Q830_9BACI|nr:YybS family protein [Salirhabdus euzebyi]MBB6454442.1 uncharacterized protein YybS (DUF2232 family) [Salirhabdus euzebyi]